MIKYIFFGALMILFGKLKAQDITIQQSLKEYCIDTSLKESSVVITISNNSDRDQWLSLNNFEFIVFDTKGNEVQFSGRHPGYLVDLVFMYSVKSDSKRRNNFILIKHQKPTNIVFSTNLFNELFFQNLDSQYVLHSTYKGKLKGLFKRRMNISINDLIFRICK